jgi:uncharacterized coiled-coil DUF342 family protein
VREQLNATLEELKKLRNLIESGKRGPSAASIRRKIQQLEWKLQTSVLTREEEEEIVRETARLEEMLERLMKVEEAKKKMIELRAELARLRLLLKDYSEAIAQRSKNIEEIDQRINNVKEVIDQLNNKIDELGKKIEEISAQIEQIDGELQQLREERKRIINELKSKEEMEVKSKGEQLLTELAKRAKEKMSRGEPLTFEELQALMMVNSDGGSTDSGNNG